MAYRAPQPRDQSHGPREQERRDRNVRDHRPPRNRAVPTVLPFPDPHLHEEDRKQRGTTTDEPRPLPAAQPRPAREHEEDDPECRDRAYVQPDGVVEVADPFDDLCPVAPGEAARGRRQRSRDDEHGDREEKNRAAGTCGRRKRQASRS